MKGGDHVNKIMVCLLIVTICATVSAISTPRAVAGAQAAALMGGCPCTDTDTPTCYSVDNDCIKGGRVSRCRGDLTERWCDKDNGVHTCGPVTTKCDGVALAEFCKDK